MPSALFEVDSGLMVPLWLRNTKKDPRPPCGMTGVLRGRICSAGYSVVNPMTGVTLKVHTVFGQCLGTSAGIQFSP
jgi:hypothetical protein